MTETKRKEPRLLRFVWGLIPWLLVGMLVAVVIVLGGWIKDEQVRLAEAKKSAQNTEIQAPRVITLTLTPGVLADKIILPAEVEAAEDLWVKTEVPAQVTRIVAQEGSMVKKGQLLVELDRRDYQARVNRIQANYNLAQVEYDRIAALVQQKIVARSQLDEIEARRKDLTAQHREARLAMNRTRITAPITGRLNEIKAKQGDFLPAGEPVAQILQLDTVKIRVGVPESDVAAVLNLEEAAVVIEALDKRRVTGRKVNLARQPRSLARLFDLELLVPNPDGDILPGMFASVVLVKALYEDALTVPLYSVITQGNERYVYVEREGRVEKRMVELGVLAGWQVHVTGGLKPGENVVAVGHRVLDDGQSVEVIRNVTRAEDITAS